MDTTTYNPSDFFPSETLKRLTPNGVTLLLCALDHYDNTVSTVGETALIERLKKDLHGLNRSSMFASYCGCAMCRPQSYYFSNNQP